MKKFFRFIRGLPSAIRLLRDPNRLDAVITLVDCVVDRDAMLPFIATLEKEPRYKRALEQKPRLGHLNWRDLEKLPENTLGHRYFQFLTENKLDPGALPILPATTPAEYVVAYYYETHDLFHVLTGFNTRPSGELGVQAFYASQSPSRHAVLLLGLSFLQTLFYTIGELDERFTAIVRGWLLGKRSQLLFGVDWTPLLSKPIEEVRALFQIPVTEMTSLVPRGHEQYFAEGSVF